MTEQKESGCFIRVFKRKKEIEEKGRTNYTSLLSALQGEARALGDTIATNVGRNAYLTDDG
jgi:hypothetical protein